MYVNGDNTEQVVSIDPLVQWLSTVDKIIVSAAAFIL